MLKRHVLWWHLLFLLICSTFVTVNINIAIISMVKTDNANSSSNFVQVCPNTSFSLMNISHDDEESDQIKNGYDWTKAEQNMVLSGYHWLNYIAILPGGILAHKHGTKRVVGFAQVISSAMSSLIPYFAMYGPLCIAWIRAIQGLLSFMSVPAGLYTILGLWSPLAERDQFGVAFLVGSVSGIFLGNLGFGFIGEYFHWEYIFHITSISGLLWGISWYFFVYDSPQLHPSISPAEKHYIESSLANAMETTEQSIPWKSIITCWPFIVTILASNSSMVLFVALATYTPVYLKTMFGLNSPEIGILTSFPLLLAGILCFCVGPVNSILIKKNLISLTTTRKLSCFIGCIVAVFPLIIIPFSECNINVAIWSIVWCIIFKGISALGSFLIIVDMSPKFCGILEGLSGTISSVLTFLFSVTINYLTGIWNIAAVWKFMFWFTAFYVISTNLLFIIFGSAEVQSWNFDKTENEENRTIKRK